MSIAGCGRRKGSTVSLPVRYMHLQVLIEMKRRVMNALAGESRTDSVTAAVRDLGRATEGLAAHEPRAALLLLLTVAEELRQAIGGSDDDKVILESALACPDAPLAEVLAGIESALTQMLQRRSARSATS